jgi:acyl carrier protein
LKKYKTKAISLQNKTSMKDLIHSRLNYVLHKHFLINQSIKLSHHHTLRQLGINEMEQIELVWYLEHDFEIALNDEEVENLHTIGDIINCLTHKLNKVYSIAA